MVKKQKVIENVRPRIMTSIPTFSRTLEVQYSNEESGLTYRNENGEIKRVVNIKIDQDYAPDKEFRAPQQWLLSARQGDDQNRLPEYIFDQRAAAQEEKRVTGESTLNRGIAWAELPERNYLELVESLED